MSIWLVSQPVRSVSQVRSGLIGSISQWVRVSNSGNSVGSVSQSGMSVGQSVSHVGHSSLSVVSVIQVNQPVISGQIRSGQLVKWFRLVSQISEVMSSKSVTQSGYSVRSIGQVRQVSQSGQTRQSVSQSAQSASQAGQSASHVC